MTVGEPEINLNTWGLKYVRKEEAHRNIGQGSDYSSKKPSDLREDEKTISYGEGSTGTHGSGTSGALSSSGKLGSKEESHGSDAPTGKFGTREAPSSVRGNKQTYTKPESSGKPANNEKSPTHKNPVPKGGGAPKNKPIKITPTTEAQQKKILASKKSDLDLAVIKCKLLKLKGFGGSERATATHGYGSKHRHGSENTGSANISEAGNKKESKTPVESKTETLAGERPDETEVTSYGEGATGTHGNDSKALKPTGEMRDVKEEGKGKGHGKNAPNTVLVKQSTEDEIVMKAIELINEAYTEMNKKFSHGEAEAVKPSHRKDDGKEESDKND